MLNNTPTVSFIIIYLVYIVVKSIWESFNEDATHLKTDTAQDSLKVYGYHSNVEINFRKNNYEYYVDGNLIDDRHDVFYLELLGIDWTKTTITEKVIYDAYYATILNLAVALDNPQIVSNDPIRPKLAKAACNYLIDRSNYLGFVN